jgi:hypothetical protein
MQYLDASHELASTRFKPMPIRIAKVEAVFFSLSNWALAVYSFVKNLFGVVTL